MKAQQRLDLLIQLGKYMSEGSPEWLEVKHRAFLENNWFIPEFIDLSVQNIIKDFLNEEKLGEVMRTYLPAEENAHPRKIGIVMAGNIPLVGFHDLLAVFLTGNIAYIKLSSKDEVLMKHVVNKLIERDENAAAYFNIQTLLKNCDAYIATGSNTSSPYFEYYFNKYPCIIRSNRTSIAVLTGNETERELEALADDVYQYFGLGCRNVSKLFVPEGYHFLPLLEAFRKYNWLAQHHKFKNNYDYNLAIHLLNHKYYMTNESILLIEDPAVFSPIGQLNYEFYQNVEDVNKLLVHNNNIQCAVGKNHLPFGSAQKPGLCDFADGVDPFAFLVGLEKN
ncbi:MAG: acyl-CoA reductase [Flavisolibacter sp.]|jgi:hypothetical protein|nr:acyl-CoA reductase [Flavisolibacter sp.]